MNVNVSPNEVHISMPSTTKRIQDYDGAYEVTPTSSEQTLETSLKRMLGDVTIHQIPFHSVSNIQGGNTITIA